MTLSSDQIAEKFSKGNTCQFWLTKKQASWLLNVWERENNTPSHFGRIQAKGQFENESGFFVWEASEGYNGSALFKVWQAEETKEEKHPLQKLIESKGLNYMEVMTSNDANLITSLLDELNNQ